MEVVPRLRSVVAPQLPCGGLPPPRQLLLLMLLLLEQGLRLLLRLG